MIFQWPTMLWALALVPLLIATYVASLRRRRLLAVQFANWRTPNTTPVSKIRRALPPTLYLAAFIALILAMARPIAVLTLMSLHDTVILAIDVSHSMQAADLEPTRLEAAQQAAREFIDAQPSGTQIGVVAFAGTALPIQRPTHDHAELMKAVDRLQTQPGTAVGNAILVSLQALFPKENFEMPTQDDDGAPKEEDPLLPPPPPPVELGPGKETSAAIVLLTDGQATEGPDPMAAAEIAAKRGVRIFTVGIGTEPGEVVKVEGISMRVKLDEETLKKVADKTLGRHFHAADTADLSEIYKGLDIRLARERRETEISAFLMAFAALSALTAAALSLLWFNRIL